MTRLLVVAPDRHEVSWASELDLVGGAVQLTPLAGRVTSERLTRVTSGQRFTILHIASDGEDGGVWLSEELLAKEELVQIARHVRAELVFLNACRSAALAQYLACQGVPCVIAYTVPVLDRNALRTASYYYEELLALGLDYRRAWERVTPCDGSLAWFAGAGYVDKAVEPLVTLIGTLQGEVVTLRRTLVRGLATMGVVNLLAVGMLLSVALPAAQGQTIPPSPLDSPLWPATATPVVREPLPPVPTRHQADEEDEEPLPPTAPPQLTPTASATATTTATQTHTLTATPRSTVVLPTLTPDWPATLTALPPC
jgi:hypothetical protein